MKRLLMLFLLLCGAMRGANIFVLHPSGADTNGGGYTGNHSLTWASSWQNGSFGPKASVTGMATSNNGSGKVRLTKAGAEFTSALVGLIANCTFSATYTSGRYEIIACPDPTELDIELAYSTDVPTAAIVIGGAILTPKTAALLAYDATGGQLLLPANQTTQTVNLVDGNANAVVLNTAALNITMIGVYDTTGLALPEVSLYPVIRAQTGSSWAANTAMVAVNAGSSGTNYFTCNKVIFDGNGLTPRVVQLGDTSGDYVYPFWNNVRIINGLVSAGANLYIGGYTSLSSSSVANSNIHNLTLSGGYLGISNAGSRLLCSISGILIVDNFSYRGISAVSEVVTTQFGGCKAQIIISRCAVGIYNGRYAYEWANRTLFVNNVVDLQFAAYITTWYSKRIIDCVFYNDANGGKVVLVDTADYVSVEFQNCVLEIGRAHV